MDHMALIDDMIMLAFAVGATARQGEQGRAAEEQLTPVVVKPYPQPVPDQPRGHRVEHLAPRKPARGGDHDEHLLIIARSEERRVGKRCVSTCRYRGSTSNKKKQK